MFPVSTRTSPLPADLAGAEVTTGQATRLCADGVGERWLLADQTQGPIEVLKFRKTFVDAPEFEARLRLRVDDLRGLRHPSLAGPRSVEWLDGGEGLGLVATHVPGRRLSEILSHARGPVFALEFIRQVTPALCALQQVRPGFAHGLLTADRVVVARDGRLVVLDTPLSAAVESLKLPPARLREDLGIAVPDAPGPVTLDPRLDVVQLGLVTLSLLLGRRIDPGDFRVHVPALLDEVATLGAPEGRDLRPWLENALQMTETPFECALDALEAMRSTAPATVVAFRAPEGAPERAQAAPAVPAAPASRPNAATPDAETPDSVTPDAMAEEPVAPAEEIPREAPVSQKATAVPQKARVRLRVVHWAVIGLTVAASVEAAAIAGLLTSRPTSPAVPTLTMVAPQLAPSVSQSFRPSDAAVSSVPATERPAVALAGVTPLSSVPPPSVPSADASARPADTSVRPRPSGQVGGVKVQAPFDGQVFEGGALVGATAGPIALDAGDHDLEIVNEAIGLRVRQRVSVKPGALTTVPLAVPNGRVNINAAPWASVSIDGNAAGDTPLANVSLPVGSHEFLFRHPQLGEQRLIAIVKADGVTRVSASFQR